MAIDTSFPYKHAYHQNPVFLAMRYSSENEATTVVDRLAKLFNIRADAVAGSEGKRTRSFFINGARQSLTGHWSFSDETTFSVTAHPVFTRDTMKDKSGASLKRLSRIITARSTEAGELPAPLSYLHHNFAQDKIFAVNDSFGIGRLYYVDSENVAAVSNNIAALGLVQKHDVEPNAEYWETYYVSGGGTGSQTYVKGIEAVPPGHKVIITPEHFVLRESHSLASQLLETRGRPRDLRRPIEAAERIIDSIRPHLPGEMRIGLSGGRDSRFVTALALRSDLSFTSYTSTPPELEAEIAEQLNRASPIPYRWERVKDSYELPFGANQRNSELLILERACAWFEFTGGDNWSTFVRFDAPDREKPSDVHLTLSGAFGDFTRGHYYLSKEAQKGDSTASLQRYLTAPTRYRKFLPEKLRKRGNQHLKNSMLNTMIKGFTGFYALDFTFLMDRLRRQYPVPEPSSALPMLTPQMATEAFWYPAVEKEASRPIRELTSELIPAWKTVPYFHEAAVGTDPDITNKVTIQPTYWETNREDFLDSIEHAIQMNNFIHLPMDVVMKEINELPEGRNRTNASFEYMFWHYAASQMVRRINAARCGE